MKHPAHARTSRRNRNGSLLGALLTGAAIVAAPQTAQAHFILKTPASWMSQDSAGAPEKLGPCGNEAGGTATGTVTGLHPGQTVTITIQEVVYHPGHYRVAIASDRSQLPAEPPVTAGSTPCGTVPVQSPPVFPVLADGLLEHSAPFTGPQTMTVTLPSNLTCTKCTLQVIEFMSDHGLNVPGGCFYHHCADVSVQAGADVDGSAGGGEDASPGSPGTDAGGSPGSGADGGGSFETPASSGGCVVSQPPSSNSTLTALAGVAAFVGFGGWVRRRRARRSA